jgi:biotin-dependent carboxylase-like uncharacterized protein
MSLVIDRVIGLVTIQDGGRPGHMHVGLAPGGALVPALLSAANRHAGNPDDVAAVEVMGTMTVRAESPTTVATDELGPMLLEAGQSFPLSSHTRRVTYLAVRGGIDAPIVLGSRSTQLSAGIGRLLRAGDRLLPGREAAITVTPETFDETSPIRVFVGPDVDAFGDAAVATLMSAPYVVLPSSNRVGTRLQGPALPRTDRPDVTRPLVIGAIEVPRDGQPIVLGPEHPTTGGYPVIGVVARDDLGRLFARPFGTAVRFRLSGGHQSTQVFNRP